MVTFAAIPAPHCRRGLRYPVLLHCLAVLKAQSDTDTTPVNIAARPIPPSYIAVSPVKTPPYPNKQLNSWTKTTTSTAITR